jgi:type I restriction enzyme R subunit
LKALKNPNKGKIITTIQKLNDLLTNNNNYDRTKEIEFLKQSKVAIIFDECHRSLFGEQFKKIKEFFNNAALLGFTGTPIFKSNSIDFNNVTNALFPTELHTYGLSQALKDNVILPIDYETPDIKAKDEQGNINDFSKNELYIIQKTKKYYDELVESVANKLSEKTMHGSFYAMLALSSIDALAYVANRLRETHPNIVFSADFSSISETFLEDSVNEKFVHKVDYKTEKTKVITDFRNNFGIEVDNEEDFTFNLIDMLKTNPVEYSKKKKLQLVLVVDKMLTGFDSE